MAVILTSIGDLIRFHRTLAGMSQDDLAKKAGVSRIMVTNLETNKRTPSIEMLTKLAVGMGAKLEINLSPSISLPVSLPRDI